MLTLTFYGCVTHRTICFPFVGVCLVLCPGKWCVGQLDKLHDTKWLCMCVFQTQAEIHRAEEAKLRAKYPGLQRPGVKVVTIYRTQAQKNLFSVYSLI